ncbi:hypothetical protein CMI47_10060 [Candidatus Pacearchaeota archaeon]|nr:hypothetical protein [Candidatus Pacearchaeota archaeon]|tara:strand:+ start:184 stop:543 length:360 start_codon:yes stop_codon:yes gene_type:complete
MNADLAIVAIESLAALDDDEPPVRCVGLFTAVLRRLNDVGDAERKRLLNVAMANLIVFISVADVAQTNLSDVDPFTLAGLFCKSVADQPERLDNWDPMQDLKNYAREQTWLRNWTDWKD